MKAKEFCASALKEGNRLLRARIAELEREIHHHEVNVLSLQTHLSEARADNRRLRIALGSILANAECTCCDMPDGEKCNECKAKLVLEGKP